MEDTVTLSREQLVELFKNWNAEVRENGDAMFDDPDKNARAQADAFLGFAAAL
jgi:hypothetical protein